MINESKPKSFFGEPEGWPTLLIGLGLLGAAGYGLHYALPWLIMMAQNTLVLFGYIAVIGIISYCLLDSHIRSAAFLAFKAFIRKGVGVFINLDPIGIAKAYIQTLIEKRQTMNKHLELLNGELKKVERDIYENEIKANAKLKEGSSAQRQFEAATDESQQLRFKSAMTLATREASRLQDSNKKLAPLQQQLQLLYKMIDKLYISSEFLILDITAEVSAKEREYKAIKEGSRAVNAAKVVFGQGGADLDIFNQSMEALKEDIGNRVGMITRFMDSSQSVLTSIDVKNGMLEEEGLKMLAEYQNKSFNAIFDTTTLGQGSTAEPILITNQPKADAAGKFKNLIN